MTVRFDLFVKVSPGPMLRVEERKKDEEQAKECCVVGPPGPPGPVGPQVRWNRKEGGTKCHESATNRTQVQTTRG